MSRGALPGLALLSRALALLVEGATMLGKLLGRLALRGWRDGERSDRRWARGRDERRWRRDLKDEMDPYEPHGWFCHCRFCRAPSEQVVTDSTVAGPVTQIRNVTGDVRIGE